MSGEADQTVIVIPARDEEPSIGRVVRTVKDQVSRVIVVDNGSTDGTAAAAARAGALVVSEPRAGYGRACQRGVAAAGDAEILVFMDGDGADDPADLAAVLDPLLEGEADFVIGTRLGSARALPGALTIAQRFGNRLACGLMRVVWGGRFTDLGPFRAIRRDALEALGMESQAFGWTVEMQVRALKTGLRTVEVPVGYRPRIGISKISGTLRGVVLAGGTILGVIGREAVTRRVLPRYCPGGTQGDRH